MINTPTVTLIVLHYIVLQSSFLYFSFRTKINDYITQLKPDMIGFSFLLCQMLPRDHVNNTPAMQFFTGISRNTHSKS